MPFQPAQSDPEYHSFQKRQSFLWVVLLAVVLLIAGIVFFIAYQFMRGGGKGISDVSSSVVTPVARALPSLLGGETETAGDYFLVSEASLRDKRFRIFKVYYTSFSKEEIFAAPWRDKAATPVVTEYGENIAVFFDPGYSVLLTRDGKTAPSSNSFFVPQGPHFTISPDGKKMVYFKQLSSVGTMSLMIRDLEKDEDVFAWPISSPASEMCDFGGWSADGTKAYCTRVKNGKAVVGAVDIKQYTYATVASVSARVARFYPAHALLVAADKSSIFTFDTNTKERKEVLALSTETVENVFLTSDASQIVFTANSKAYAVNRDGSNRQEIKNTNRVISLGSNEAYNIFEVMEADGGSYYIVMDIAGSKRKELYGMTKDIAYTQFIGWFSK